MMRLPGPTGMKSMIALFDQALVSGMNFLAAFLLARLATPEEYGSFALGFSIVLFLNGISYTLISTPMSVIGANKHGENAKEYFSSLLRVQLLSSLTATAVLGLGSVLISRQDWTVSFRGTWVAMTLAIPFIQIQDFLRRVLLCRLQTMRALFNDGVMFVVQALGVLALVQPRFLSLAEPPTFSARTVFFLFGCAGAIGSVVGLIQLRGVFTLRIHNFLPHIWETWHYAKWGLLGMVGSVASLQATTWIIAAFGGEVAVASVEAPRLLAGVMNVLIFGLANVLIPQATRVFEEQKVEGLRHFLRKSYTLWLLLSLSFFGFMFFFGQDLLSLAFGEQYLEFSTVLTLWAVYYGIMGIRQVPGYGIAAMRRPDMGFWVTLGVGALTVSTTGVLMIKGGISLVVGGRIAGEVAMLVLLHYTLYALLGRVSRTEAMQHAQD